MTSDPSDDPFVAGLRVLMDERGEKPAPLAQRSGLGITAVRDLFRKGSSPKISTALAIAQAMGTTIDGVINARSTDADGATGRDRLNLCEVSSSKVSFPPAYLRHISPATSQHLEVLAVRGDSMQPTLRRGDIVVFDRTDQDISHEGMFVLRYGGMEHVKRVSRTSCPNLIRVMSDNRDAYPAQDMMLSDVVVAGRVVWYGIKV